MNEKINILEKEIQVNDYLTKSNLPASDYVINPYVGCPHGCKYCYASFMKRFTGHKEDWGTFIDIKKCNKKINIKKCNYFAIKTTSFESENIIDNINKGIKEYIKALNYELLDMPRIEVYYEDFVEILIPIT